LLPYFFQQLIIGLLLVVFRKSWRLWDVEKSCTSGHATDDSMVYAHCMLDTQGYKYTQITYYIRTDHDQQHCYHHVPTVNQRLLLQLIGSWWWARWCPKHVELYLNDKQ
jgi:hypothetical protein